MAGSASPLSNVNHIYIMGTDRKLFKRKKELNKLRHQTAEISRQPFMSLCTHQALEN